METNLLPEEIYSKLPPLLQALTEPFDGREKDIVLLASLGVLSAALPRVFGFYRRNRVSPNLFVMVIAPPASGKGRMNTTRKLIEKIHRDILTISRKHREDCKSEARDKKHHETNCPEISLKIIPGNVSSAKIYSHLASAVNGLLIFETEADTISEMLKQGWSNFSDILRKAFHHETISISRQTDEKYIEIQRPELSLVISGTPSQVKPLIQSQENGLFSRFMFYYFTDTESWKDVSPLANSIDYDSLFNGFGNQIAEMYNVLSTNQHPLEILLTAEQWTTLNETFSDGLGIFIQAGKLDITSSIKRAGLILFRVCMILSVIRCHNSSFAENQITCSSDDFEAALSIVKTTVNHAIEVGNLLDDKNKTLPVNQTLVYNHVGNQFTRVEFINAGRNIAPERTLDHWLSRWVNLKIIVKISNGVYKKLP